MRSERSDTVRHVKSVSDASARHVDLGASLRRPTSPDVRPAPTGDVARRARWVRRVRWPYSSDGRARRGSHSQRLHGRLEGTAAAAARCPACPRRQRLRGPPSPRAATCCGPGASRRPASGCRRSTACPCLSSWTPEVPATRRRRARREPRFSGGVGASYQGPTTTQEGRTAARGYSVRRSFSAWAAARRQT